MSMTPNEDRAGKLYWLLARLAEQLDWERRCAEQGWDPCPLTFAHRDIEKRVRDEIAGTIEWWEHAAPENAHRLVGSTEPEVLARRWASRPDPLLPDA